MNRAFRHFVLILCFSVPSWSVDAATPDPHNWSQLVDLARGQTVYFSAWAGDARINRFIGWAAERVREQYGVNVQHVKLGDTSEAVSRVLAERLAGNDDQGSVDLLWINGENFAAMKAADLLFGPWAEQMPNFALVDADHHPEMREDFTVPVDGLELPWTRSQLVFYYDSEQISEPPRSMRALLRWSLANPGQFTYPRPPEFLGTTFLKQALLELAPDLELLYAPVVPQQFEAVTAPLWRFLDELHPSLLRGGRAFPGNGSELRRMMGDGEVTLALSFRPAEASTGIATGELPASVRSYVLDGGTLGNVSFMAIPFNASNKAGAMVLANFLLSPEAQAYAYDPAVTGSATTLNLKLLSAEQRQLFERIDQGPSMLTPEQLGKTIREPHPDWVGALERAWLERYGAR